MAICIRGIVVLGVEKGEWKGLQRATGVRSGKHRVFPIASRLLLIGRPYNGEFGLNAGVRAALISNGACPDSVADGG